MRLPALIVLVGVAACDKQPGEVIVGRWEPCEDWAAIVDANWRATVGAAAQAGATAPSSHDKPPRVIPVAFYADGTYHFPGDDRLGPYGPIRWSLVHIDATRVVVTIHTPFEVHATRREFVYESSDVIREVGGILDGVRMRRVK